MSDAAQAVFVGIPLFVLGPASVFTVLICIRGLARAAHDGARGR